MADDRNLGPVLQEWVTKLSFMQQSVLLSAMRGPDGIKHQAEKALKRWLRRSVLYSAFETRKHGKPTRMNTAAEQGGGSFTGPVPEPFLSIDEAARVYLSMLEMMPYHYITHFMAAAQIIGFKHDVPAVREWWHSFHAKFVKKLHMHAETEEEMDKRLGDFEDVWRANVAQEK